MGATVGAGCAARGFAGGSCAAAGPAAPQSATNPAAAGDVLVVYWTGAGQTTPATATGEIVPASPLRNTAATTATIGGVNAPVIYSIASPGFAGLYQTALRVPPGLAVGSQPLVLTVNGATSNASTIAVR